MNANPKKSNNQPASNNPNLVSAFFKNAVTQGEKSLLFYKTKGKWAGTTWSEVADAIKYWYDIPRDERKKRGLIGRQEFQGEMGLNSKNMCKTLVDGIETTFKNWKPKEKFNVYKLR